MGIEWQGTSEFVRRHLHHKHGLTSMKSSIVQWTLFFGRGMLYLNQTYLGCLHWLQREAGAVHLGVEPMPTYD